MSPLRSMNSSRTSQNVIAVNKSPHNFIRSSTVLGFVAPLRLSAYYHSVPRSRISRAGKHLHTSHINYKDMRLEAIGSTDGGEPDHQSEPESEPNPKLESKPEVKIRDVAPDRIDKIRQRAREAAAGLGGSSREFTQGEIIFATILSFIVLLAMTSGAFTFYRNRRRKTTGGGRTAIAADVGKEIVVNVLEAGDVNPTSTRALLSSLRGSQCNLDRMAASNGPAHESTRRATLDGIRQSQHQRTGVHRGPLRNSASSAQMRRPIVVGQLRRSHSSHAFGTPVSSKYKQAAIDHMVIISGRPS